MRGDRLVDGLRLAVGTLTVLPVPAPRRVDRPAAAVAMLAAVVPGAAVGLLAGAVAVAAAAAGVPPLVVGALAVAVGALTTRALHLDGLADTADGLAVVGDRARALEVMHRGDVGPAGASTLVLVLLAQASGVAALVGAGRSWPAVLGLLVLAWATSRAALPLLTVHGTVPAQRSGLGAGVLGSVPRALAALPILVLAALALPVGAGAAGAVLVGALAAVVLAVLAHRRLGGLSGDVLGAAVEVALAACLAVLAAWA